MGRIARGSEEARRVDSALAVWRQGDVALEEDLFVHLGDGARALTRVAEKAEGPGVRALPGEVDGLVVVTQTCDVARSCIDRPYVEVSPLVAVDETAMQQIVKARRPRYAHVSAVAESRLVADLDRTMTVEKAIVALWKRTPGWRTDQQAREFASALARKRARFALPDDSNRQATASGGETRHGLCRPVEQQERSRRTPASVP